MKLSAILAAAVCMLSAHGLSHQCLPILSNNFQTPSIPRPPVHDQNDDRPPASQRLFVSPAVEKVIANLTARIKNPDVARMFANCFPNSLDTTVRYHSSSPNASVETFDTFVVTGDIDAMWLRDSTNQMMPLLSLVKEDAGLSALIAGVVQRQARSVLLDAYANAFNPDSCSGSGHSDDQTSRPSFYGSRLDAMVPGVYERKYELDSLCNVLKLAHRFTKAAGNTNALTATWKESVKTILSVFRYQQMDQQQEGSNPDYTFQRTTTSPTETLYRGRGFPNKYTGMIKSAFRGSDDACMYAFNIPANIMAAVELNNTAELLDQLGEKDMAKEARSISSAVINGVHAHGIVSRNGKQIYAYEVDGYGNSIVMDDANVPSLLSLPYLGFCSPTDPLYAATREAILGPTNPWWFSGSAASGIGGPHEGPDMIWPMSLAIQSLTSNDKAEVENILNTLTTTTAGTHYMHESFNKDNAGSYTRSWFAWANALYAEVIFDIAARFPSLIF